VSNIVPVRAALVPASQSSIEKVDRLTGALLKMPQLQFVTEHMIHAGMYTRTLLLPADTLCTAVFFKIPTVIIIVGRADIFSNDDVISVDGYTVVPGSAGRKIAVWARSRIGASMIFPTKARTVEEAQEEFTDEVELLVPLSEKDRHRIVITGE
jgi:hypothetical protein